MMMMRMMRRMAILILIIIINNKRFLKPQVNLEAYDVAASSPVYRKEGHIV